MELVLTRLKDFSLKSATFNDCKSAEIPSFRNTQDDKEKSRQQKLDIEGALSWLRKELMEMRSQDQMLIKQLMELHSGIQELKQECTDGNDVDSESDTEDSICSSSGDVCPSPFSSAKALYISPRKTSSRRSSMP
ncbi:protein FAM167A-like [Acipenser oxyrinchus oxyrinchus]|uniref:Protein FAM167A-like n=1 Tax=Acipenser oxyrinchus oxyrinchus TaxID=40147 RepID=A0AAD8GDZ6_ACIOX|nr:protein FAM167A-like [Acipenser oxyrinchus oxyrinchus]